MARGTQIQPVDFSTLNSQIYYKSYGYNPPLMLIISGV
jgi:hypothetical protein